MRVLTIYCCCCYFADATCVRVIEYVHFIYLLVSRTAKFTTEFEKHTKSLFGGTKKITQIDVKSVDEKHEAKNH